MGKWTARNRARWNGYAPNKIQCHICQGWYYKLATHTVQRHDITARELKIMLGLDVKKGILDEKGREHLRALAYKNKALVIDKNLLQKGKHTRFTKGKVPKYTRSAQTVDRLRKQIKSITPKKI